MSIITKKQVEKRLSELEATSLSVHWASCKTNISEYSFESVRIIQTTFALKREYRVALKYGLQIVM